jgi:hypothetical protein
VWRGISDGGWSVVSVRDGGFHRVDHGQRIRGRERRRCMVESRRENVVAGGGPARWSLRRRRGAERITSRRRRALGRARDRANWISVGTACRQQQVAPRRPGEPTRPVGAAMVTPV